MKLCKTWPLLLVASHLLVLISPSNVAAQIWDEDVKWIYSQDEYIPSSKKHFRQFIPVGDTIINNVECLIIQEQYLTIIQGGIDTSVVSNYFIDYAYPIVYIYDVASNKFRQLYNFDLTTGDTLRSFNPDVREGTEYLIDTVMEWTVSGQPRKVQVTTSLGDFSLNYVIDGIGSWEYLFSRATWFDPPPGGGLVCFWDGDMAYPDSHSCDLLSVSIKDQPRQLDELQVFPVPTGNQLHVVAQGLETIQLFSMEGQLLISSDQGPLDLSQLSAGVYLLNVKTERSVQTRFVNRY